MKPLISVITPTHRRPDLLYRCIKAVQKSDLKNYEHIVVGDNCPFAEKVVNLFDDNRIKYHSSPSPHIKNVGAVGKNIGIKNAKSDYIVYCDDDNIILPNHLSVVYNELSKGTDICRINMCEIDIDVIGNGSIKRVLEYGIPNLDNISGRVHRNDMQCYGHTKEVIEQVGFWNTSTEISKDKTWTRNAVGEDDYLIRKFKNSGVFDNIVDLPDVSFIYFGRGACVNGDEEYDNGLSNESLFVYSDLIKKLDLYA